MSRTFLFVGAALLLSAAMYPHLGDDVGGNRALLLFTAKAWLQGRILYVDVFEINPPLIIWMYAIPAWLALHIAVLSDVQWLALMGMLLLMLSAGACMRLLMLEPQFSCGNRQRAGEFMLLFFFVFAACMFSTNFFDREECFIVLAFPYILRFRPGVARMHVPFGFAALIGAMAAAGFAIKPQCLIVLGGILLIRICRERSPAVLGRVENRIIYAALIAYASAAAWRYPAYMHVVMPMALVTYGAAGAPLLTGLSAACLAFITLVLICLGFHPRRGSPYRGDIAYFLQVSVFLLCYALTNNGWDYAYVPLLALLLFTAGWRLWELSYASGQPGHDASATLKIEMLSCALALGLNLYMASLPWLSPYPCRQNARCAGLSAIAGEMEAREVKSFGALSSEFESWVYLSRNTRADFVTRFNYLWMLPAFVNAPAAFAEKYHWIIDYVATAAADDLKRNRPAMMLIDSGPSFFNTGKPVILPDMLSRAPAFRREWSHYRYERTENFCRGGYGGLNARACSLDIYYRNAGP